jgi:uncharacterized YccA/Bax inhibitor family protein
MPSGNDQPRFAKEVVKLTPDEVISNLDERRPAYHSDPVFYRHVVYMLGGVLVLSLISLSVLAFFKISPPEGIVAIGSGALGVLAGVFVGGQRKD